MASMSHALTNKLDILKDRAAMFAKARDFFAKKGVLEVDVPMLSLSAPIDLYIDIIEATCCHKKAFLHSSPEYGMKRLLSEGIGDIYQISHVFRDHERGSRHSPEFTMAEWYRIGFSFEEMIQETINFIRLFLNEASQMIERMTYHEAFSRYIGYYPQSSEERDSLYAFEVEPHFGNHGLTVITHFPSEQAALARLGPHGFAERFEIYFQAMELANGYHELTDSMEQRKRLIQANEAREKHGKTKLPVDEEFVAALEKGVPDCCGVAVGFDRLIMLRNQLEDIHEASSFFI
jgi:elongation factor P--(R)-beta-lysine ligase